MTEAMLEVLKMYGVGLKLVTVMKIFHGDVNACIKKIK